MTSVRPENDRSETNDSPETPAPATVARERGGIAFAALAYLTFFNQTLPHGDALRIVRQIDASHLVWNPNHLLLDPLGYGAYHLINALGLHWPALSCFELLSAIATFFSLQLFHLVLIRAGVTAALPRLLGVAGLFSTACFLALAGSQYFFVIQMPFLIGALYLCLGVMNSGGTGPRAPRQLYGAGMLLAIATAIMFNNLLLVAAAGLAVGLTGRSWKSWNWRNSARLWAGAAMIGVPVFVGGYLLGDSSSDFIGWLTSYQGDAQSNLNNIYGTKMSLSSVIKAMALVGYNLILGNMVELAGLATVLWTLVSGGTLEFIPQWVPITLGLIVVPLAVGFHAIVAYYALRHIFKEPSVRLLGAWILAFAVFNFLWQAGDEIFWLQITPATWLLFLMSQGYAPRLTSAASAPVPQPSAVRGYALAAFVVLLLAVNTFNVVAPAASSSFSGRQVAHASMLKPGDLEIFPGWDQQKWTMLDEDAPPVRQLLLMNMVAAGPGKENSIERLPDAIDAQLRGGGRVIVGRLYDKDEDLSPWYGLAGQGWPRAKIQSLLSGYCTRPLEKIGSVVFRELYACEAAGAAVPR